MASKKRTAQPIRNREKQRRNRSATRSDPKHKELFEASVLAAQIIESMVENLREAIKCVKVELKKQFRVDCDFASKNGRVHVYLRPLEGLRKHAHIVVKTIGTNKVVSVTHYGRSFA